MKSKQSLRNIILASALLAAAAGCKKSTDVPTATTPTPSRDTLISFYTVGTINNPESGQIFLSLFNPAKLDTGAVIVADQDGRIIRQKSYGSSVINFEKWTVNGTVRYTYALYDLSNTQLHANYFPCTEVITDSNLNEIKRVDLIGYQSSGLSTANQKGLDGHDFIYLSDDHYILETYYPKTVTNVPSSLSSNTFSYVASNIIQEVDHGSVLWEWDGSNYPEFYSTSVEGNSFNSTSYQDYMHLNSMTIDPRDNNLICSFRNMNQVLKINRSTGAVMWRLGGSNSDFPLTADQQFLRQHHATLTDNNQTLLLFDDGEATERPYSRILEYTLDEANKQVTGFKAYNIPAAFSQYMGSVQKRGDWYVIGGGTGNYVLEVNPTTGEKKLELSAPGYYFYRALKY